MDFENNQIRWDQDDDGDIDVDDILAAFDADGDGQIGSNELQKLAEQLSSQVDYNNMLIEHLKTMEEEQVRIQEDMKEKQNALKQAIAVGDAARSEANDLRRKLAISQEVAENMSNQCRESRVEVSALRRESENLARQRDELSQRNEELENERKLFDERMGAMREQLNNQQEEFDRSTKDVGTENEQLKHDFDNLSKELADLRARTGPLQAQNAELQEQVRNLEEALDEMTHNLEGESKENERLEARSREQDRVIASLREKQKEIQFTSAEGDTQRQELLEQIRDLEAQIEQLEEQLTERERKMVDISKVCKLSVEENSALKGELETVGNELLQQAKQRAMEQERWASRLAEAQEELKKVSYEARVQAQEYAMESQSKSEETLQMRKEAEEQYLALQNEHTHLHQLLHKMQQDTAKQQGQFNRERENFEHKIHQLQHEKDKLLDDNDALERKINREKTRHQHALEEAKKEMGSRGSNFVTILSQMKNHVRQLQQEATANRDLLRQISAEYQTLVSFSNTIGEKQSKPLSAWYEETKQSLEALVEHTKASKKSSEDAKDDLRRAQLEKEEERAKSLMLDEQVSQLEHELSARDQRVLETESKMNDRILQLQREKELAQEGKEEADLRLRKMQKQIDESTAQNRSLQSNAQGYQTQLAENQSRASQRVSELEEKINELSLAIRTASKEKEEMQTTRSELQRLLSQKEQQNQALTAQLSKAENDKQKSDKALHVVQQRAKEQIGTLQQSLKRYETQSEQTKSLLKLMQEQRAQMQEENMQLKAELDDVYHQGSG